MGIYLGQLPPAEIARLKAELAETLIANFCYPRFFDHRTQSLQMRPVDRSKRQEVWLYLSSVDFTAWSRIDLMSPDFQHQIERLFIQFVQRNRSFFGEQGRRRMSDIRMLINTCASSVTSGLRNHLTGKKPTGTVPFGSPRPVISWNTPAISKRADLTWEQIANATQVLQVQLQEFRGEVKTAQPAESRPETVQSTSPSRRASSTTTAGSTQSNGSTQPAASTTATGTRTSSPVLPPVTDSRSSSSTTLPPVTPAPQRRPEVQSSPIPSRKSGPLHTGDTAKPVTPAAAKATESALTPTAPQPALATASPVGTRNGSNGAKPATTETNQAAFAPPVQSRPLSQSTSPVQATNPIAPNAPRDVMSVGEDDIAIFEQMRHQLVVWLRIEAVSAGLEISNQGPAQLLELLRQQARVDETRIQVVSTLLNLANQVIKTGLVSVLDYKQALMFHLMHTRR